MADHSGGLFNQKYFEGFQKRIVLDTHQRRRVEYVYEGMYYQLDATDRMWRWRKTLCVLLTVLSTAGLILLMTLNTAANGLPVVIVTQVLLLLCLLGCLWCAGVRAVAGRRMIRWEYRMAAVSLKELAAVGLVIFIVVLLLSLLPPLRGMVPWSGREGLCAAGYLGSAVPLVGLLRLTRQERYVTEESQDMPTLGVDITNDNSF